MVATGGRSRRRVKAQKRLKRNRRARRAKAKKMSLTTKVLHTKTSPFASELYTRLSMSNYNNFNNGVDVPTTAVLRLNSLYNPRYSGWNINGQPFYFDQLCSSTGPYTRYTVYGCKVRIEAQNLTSSVFSAMINRWQADENISGLNFTTLTTGASMLQYATQPNCVYQPHISVSGNSKSTRVFKRYFDIAKLYGISKQALLDEDDFSGTYNNGPTNNAYLETVLGVDAGTGGTSHNLGVVCKWVFYVRFHSLLTTIAPS